jgi:Major Facilitator Superfamily
VHPQLTRDRLILYARAFLRSLGVSFLGILLGLYLAKLNFDAAQIGLVIGAGLAGAAVSALLVTLAGDRLGRRRVLTILALTSAVGAGVAAVASNLAVLIAASFIAMLNGMGRDRGSALILEQAILPTTTGDERRTLGFALYSVVQDVGTPSARFSRPRRYYCEGSSRLTISHRSASASLCIPCSLLVRRCSTRVSSSRAMIVMRVRIVWMRVSQGLMPMRMGMPRAGRHRYLVFSGVRQR